MHKHLLTSRSTLFEKALSGNFKGSNEGIISLKDHEPFIFAVYVDCLYTNSLALAPIMPDRDAGNGGITLCKVYVLAEKLQDTDTKNLIMKCLVDGTGSGLAKEVAGRKFPYIPCSEAVKIIYGGTLPGSMARKLLVDMYTCQARGRWIASHQGWPMEFLTELLADVLDKRIPPDDPLRERVSDKYMEKKK